MAERGWTVPDWPKDYGGGGLSPAETKILKQEMARIGARNPLMSFGISMLGPALLKYGSEEQKKRFLPEIARGEIRWCQGYSEPSAGSDLACLQTKCEDKGDHWLVNGQKVWTSYADKADWIFCLVRTDPQAPKHKGISFLLFDMASPGVSTKPILLISGYSPFCETFFDDVKVPKDQLVGELNKGWDVAKYLLGHEREMISGMGLGGSASEALGDRARRTRWPTIRCCAPTSPASTSTPWPSGRCRERFIDELKAGRAHPAQPSMMKYAGTELNKRRHELVMAAGGSDALEWESDRSKRRQGGARMAAHQGQFDRGRHQRDPARHRRQAHPRICREPEPMPLYLTDDQAMLRDTARELHGRAKARSRSSCATGATRAARTASATRLWKQFAEMGFTGILIDEADGGLGLGHVEAGIVLEEIGRNLTPSPFLISAVAVRRGAEGQRRCASAGSRASSPATRSRRWRSTKGAKHRPEAIAMRAERSGNGFRLTGRKQFVVQGASADVTRRRAPRQRDGGPDPVRGREGRAGPRASRACGWPTAASARG